MSQELNPYEGMSINEILLQELDGQYGKRRHNFLKSIQQQGNKSKRAYIMRGCNEANDRLLKDYFSEAPVYSDAQFRRRFRMRRHVFLCIINELKSRYPYSQQRLDAIGMQGFSAIQKCTAVIRMLSYGASADELDKYLRIAECTAIECTRKFLKAVKEVFGPYYLRKPHANDTSRLLRMGEARGFPGMLGSIDCMHWEWKNCLVAWKGMYTRGD